MTPNGWIEGIVDLSHWQSPVSFPQMKAGGTLAVILKATQGSNFIDPTFALRAAQAMAAGLLVGAYHFADGSDPASQADLFLRVTNGFPVLAIDLEQNDTLGDTVTVYQAAMLVSIIQPVTGRVPLIYIGRYGPDGRGTGLPNTILSRCPLWLPEYNAPSPRATWTSPQPSAPPGWDAPTLWQWTNKGQCPGVGPLCDLNAFAGTTDELRTFWNGD